MIDQELTTETLRYGKQFVLHLDETRPYANEIAKVSLIRLGAATHSFDQNTRFVPLEFTVESATRLRVHAPADGKIAPPGHYMLFILRDNSSDTSEFEAFWPSKAMIVEVKKGLMTPP